MSSTRRAIVACALCIARPNSSGGLPLCLLGTPHETEIYVRLRRVDVMFSIVYPDSDNELRPIQERRILYLDLAD